MILLSLTDLEFGLLWASSRGHSDEVCRMASSGSDFQADNFLRKWGKMREKGFTAHLTTPAQLQVCVKILYAQWREAYHHPLVMKLPHHERVAQTRQLRERIDLLSKEPQA